MADSGATEILDALMRNMREIVSTRTIVGEPIQNNGITILPLMRVALGFGAGAGRAAGERITTASMPSENGRSGQAGGGGGGGGVSITPVGFLVVDKNRAMMITPKSTKWDWVIETVPELVDRLTTMMRNRRGNNVSEAEMNEPATMGGPEMGEMGETFPGEPPMGGPRMGGGMGGPGGPYGR